MNEWIKVSEKLPEMEPATSLDEYKGVRTSAIVDVQFEGGLYDKGWVTVWNSGGPSHGETKWRGWSWEEDENNKVAKWRGKS